MEYLDARRLTGPSLLFDGPGSILDVRCTAAEAERLVPVWEKHVKQMLEALGWSAQREFASLVLAGGVSMGFTANIDALYAASEINEWAWAACDHELGDADAPDFDEAVAALQNSIAEEANPELLQLEESAADAGVTMLWDDDEASLGLGEHSAGPHFAICPSGSSRAQTARRQLSAWLPTSWRQPATVLVSAPPTTSPSGTGSSIATTGQVPVERAQYCGTRRSMRRFSRLLVAACCGAGSA